jgi:predicted RNase H-like HicB family nuclease
MSDAMHGVQPFASKASVPDLPGVMACGAADAVCRVKSIALQGYAEMIDRGKEALGAVQALPAPPRRFPEPEFAWPRRRTVCSVRSVILEL